MSQKNVLKKIKTAMLDSELTQEGLGKKLGVNKQMISHWFTGYRNPSLTSLKKIADATSKPLIYFLDNYQEIKGHANNVTQTGDIVVSHAEMESLKKDAETELIKKDNELLKKDAETELLKKDMEILKLQKDAEIESLKKDNDLLKKDNELLKKDAEIELIKKEIENLKLKLEIEQLKNELLNKDKKNKDKKK